MTIQRLNDNSENIFDENSLARQIAGKTLEELSNEGIFVFPPNLSEIEDLTREQKVLEVFDKTVKTGNVMGFLSDGKDSLIIQSRFAENEQSDYFLQYMLSKVLNFNLLNLDFSFDSKTAILDLLPYLFVKYFRQAMTQGIYKSYQRFEYNDANLKGTINIAWNIKQNSPFMGKVSYSTREFTFDNPVNQLILLAAREVAKSVKFDRTMQAYFRQFTELVSDQSENLTKIISINLKNPVRHKYFDSYQKLQRLALAILTKQRISLADSRRKIHGILFDGAWLWEEYMAAILTDFEHPQNKKSFGGISLYSDHTHTVYPDFYSDKMILDAKYKRVDKADNGGIDRKDLYQIISYLHILSAESAGVIFPSTETKRTLIGKLNGFGGEIFKLSLGIPQNSTDYNDFCEKIEQEEKLLLNWTYR